MFFSLQKNSIVPYHTHTHTLHLAHYNFLRSKKNLLKNFSNEEKNGEEDSFIEMSITREIEKKVWKTKKLIPSLSQIWTTFT